MISMNSAMSVLSIFTLQIYIMKYAQRSMNMDVICAKSVLMRVCIMNDCDMLVIIYATVHIMIYIMLVF